MLPLFLNTIIIKSLITNPLSNVVSYSENPLQHFGVSDDIHFDKLTRDIIIANCDHLGVFFCLFF